MHDNITTLMDRKLTVAWHNVRLLFSYTPHAARYILCGRYTEGVFDVVSSRTRWCLAYLYSECYAFPESLVYAVTHTAQYMTSVISGDYFRGK
jgi:hypothetical protein